MTLQEFSNHLQALLKVNPEIATIPVTTWVAGDNGEPALAMPTRLSIDANRQMAVISNDDEFPHPGHTFVIYIY